MQGIYAQLTGGVHLPSIYMHGTRSSSGCSGMQGIYAQLTVYWYSRHLCSIDRRGVDLPVGVLVCKASVLNWLGVHLPSMYMYCTRSSSGCSGMQGICAQLTGGVHLPSIYMHCTRSSSGVVVCKASIFNWLCTGIQGIYAQLTGGSRSTSGCISMQGICLDWLVGSICLLYICIVLDLAVAVVVCKASIFNWLCIWYSRHMLIDWGSRSTSGCIGMQGICAWLTGGVHLPSIYIFMHCTRSSSGVVVCKASMLNWLGWYVRHLCLIDWGSAFYIYVLY